MNKIPKKEFSPQVVIADTSSLFHQEKNVAISPSFDNFLDEYSTIFDLQLKIPEVVIGELLFQHTNQALDRLSKANEEINAVSRVTGKTYSHRVTERRVRKEIQQKFDHWIAQRRAELLPVPESFIDWNKIVQNSIWRKAPFSRDKEEKGFRDSVILETIIHYCETEKGIPIVFICKDQLLRTTSEQALDMHQLMTSGHT